MLTAADVKTMGHIAETWPAEDVLAWAGQRFAPRLTFATGFGAEGCVLIDLVARFRVPVDVFTLDTGLLFPETYDLWRTLEARYGLSIRRIQPAQTVAEQAATYGDALWQHGPSRCCDLRKVTPLEAHLRSYDAWISAIRRDQTKARSTARAIEWDERFGLVKVNPLIRWTKSQVWAYLHEHDVPYNPLHDHGFPSVGCVPCTSAVGAGEDDRAGRWRGLVKTECGLHAR
jgi:phosphoadenosine phosphosulfate reductase